GERPGPIACGVRGRSCPRGSQWASGSTEPGADGFPFPAAAGAPLTSVRSMSRHIGIVAVSAEGAALCYRTICVEGAELVGRYGPPHATMATDPLAEYMRHIEGDRWDVVGRLLLASAGHAVKAGAELLICPANTVDHALDLVRAQSP